MIRHAQQTAQLSFTIVILAPWLTFLTIIVSFADVITFRPFVISTDKLRMLNLGVSTGQN